MTTSIDLEELKEDLITRNKEYYFFTKTLLLRLIQVIEIQKEELNEGKLDFLGLRQNTDSNQTAHSCNIGITRIEKVSRKVNTVLEGTKE